MTLSIIFCEAVGSLGTIFTAPNIPTWYATLPKAALNPPTWVFGPAWGTLFALMGIALYLVWEKRSDKKAVRLALAVFALQFVFNILWSALFFGLHSPLLGLVGITALWLSIVATIYTFSRVSRAAAWLLVPYLLWVTFASYLNLSVWLLLQ